MAELGITLKTSPLHQVHLDLGARMVPFAGWEMPVQYEGILAEHKAVRTKVGIFDISHMGEIFISGGEASPWLDSLVSNRVAKLDLGEAQYSLLTNERGGIIDDLIIYRIGEQEFLLIVNASCLSTDLAWLESHRGAAEVEIADRSEDFAAMAIQGPETPRQFADVFGPTVRFPAHNTITRIGSQNGAAFLCGTGYTGEIGFELICPTGDARHWWQRFSDAGAHPCGLGARDILRLEMGFPLNGNDLSPDRTPIEAGLGFFVDFEKESLPGSDVLVSQKQQKPSEKLAALQVEGKSAPLRPGYAVIADGQKIGVLTSGGHSPSIGCGIGMAYLPLAYTKIDTPLFIDIRGKSVPVRVVRKPFYQPAS